MSATNGTLTPPKALDIVHPSSGTKRKRSESRTSSNTATATNAPNQKMNGTLNAPASIDGLGDILVVLESYDPTPSVLHHSLLDVIDRASSEAPALKRQKIAEGAAAEDIASKAAKGAYAFHEEVQKDIHEVCEAQIATIKAQERPATGPASRLSLADMKTMQQLMTFELLSKDILTREAEQKGSRGTRKDHAKVDGNATAIANGVKQEPASPKTRFPEQTSRTVLSLFGNAPTPKQLFSSLQRSSLDVDGRQNVIAEIPLEELGLPNMLTASKLMPISSSSVAKRTFGDVFAPPATLPQLVPPKGTRQNTTRSGSISFAPGQSGTKPARKIYTTQPLTVGDWVTYGTADDAHESSSASTKRKQRDRSLSTGESAKALPDELAVEDAAQEEALFRAAYSSFAPTQDNAKAMVPEEVKNMVWWQKAGQHRFDEHFALDPALDKGSYVPEDGQGLAEEAKLYEEAIERFDEDAMSATPARANDMIVRPEELLHEISELLRTLSSYQKIRNSYIPTQSRTPASPRPLLSAILGTPSDPSKEETEVYRNLRSQLADMIDRLPPYAVAKLDGEQLEDLRISRSILMESKQYNGTLEEDQLTRISRNAAAVAASTSVPRTSSATGYGSQYGRTPSFSQSAARSAHAPQSSFYGGTRTPAPSYGRPTSNQAINTPSTSVRQPYSPASTYGSQANRPAAPQSYGQSSGSQYYQRPTYGQQYGQASPHTQSQPQGGQGGTTPSVYQSRVQNAALTGQGSYGQQRPAHTPGSALPNGQVGSQQQHNPGRVTPTNLPPRNQIPSALGPSGFHTSMTSEQQQTMMERQRAQLAMQPQARMVTQADIARQGTGTPQSPQSNGVAPL